MGCYNTFFLAGIDQRNRAFVCSCGFSPLAGDPRPERWGMESLQSDFTQLNYDAQGFLTCSPISPNWNVDFKGFSFKSLLSWAKSDSWMCMDKPVSSKWAKPDYSKPTASVY
jgi:hypothetical protein